MRLAPALPVLALALSLASPARSEDAPTPDGTPGRILLGQTAQIDPPGTFRLTLHEIAVAQTLSFVPFRSFELTLGHLLPPRHDQSFFTAMARYRFLDFERFQVAAGVAWLQGYPFGFDKPYDYEASQLDHYPVFELAVTGVFDSFRLNLELLYVLVADQYDGDYLEYVGIDDLVVSVGGEWTAKKWLRVFLETTVIVPVEHVDDPGSGFPGGISPFPFVAAGTRFVIGRWDLEAALVNFYPWLSVSVAFGGY